MPEAVPEAVPEAEPAPPAPSPQGAPAEPPYRAEAVRSDEQWHLTVRSLDHHPYRGEVCALVVTVTPAEPSDGLPTDDLDHMLRECGFARDGDWSEQSDHWTTPCHQPDTGAAPPAPQPS